MKLVLQPMTETTFQDYLREHEDEYARDRMITDRESYEQALQTTRAQHASMLPQGVSTPGHFFFVLQDSDRGEPVGYLWFACRETSRELFLYHILIKQSERRKGYGRLALAAIDDQAKQLNCRAIWLNVFGHNRSAIEFYLAAGYQTAAMHMCKHLGTE